MHSISLNEIRKYFFFLFAMYIPFRLLISSTIKLQSYILRLPPGMNHYISVRKDIVSTLSDYCLSKHLFETSKQIQEKMCKWGRSCERCVYPPSALTGGAMEEPRFDSCTLRGINTAQCSCVYVCLLCVCVWLCTVFAPFMGRFYFLTVRICEYFKKMHYYNW